MPENILDPSFACKRNEPTYPLCNLATFDAKNPCQLYGVLAGMKEMNEEMRTPCNQPFRSSIISFVRRVYIISFPFSNFVWTLPTGELLCEFSGWKT
jgi:hypothetical protein